MLTQQEHYSRKGRVAIMSAAEFRRYNDLPYGQWTCEDGRQVLFNRFYEPTFRRRPGEAEEPADPQEWVRFKKQKWFDREDGTLSEAAIVRTATTALAAGRSAT